MTTSWNFGKSYANVLNILPTDSATTTATISLNSAYTYATGGAAFAYGFVPSESANLTDFWVYIDSYAGTWGSATDQLIDVEVREGLNGSNIPGTTLTGSFQIDLSTSPTGWFKTTLGSPIALVAGRQYLFVVGDANAGGTNYVVICNRGSSFSSVNNYTATTLITTNGFSTAGTAGGGAGAIVAKVGSLYYGGALLGTIATITTGTYARGCRFKLPSAATLVGWRMLADYILLTTAGNVIKLFADATAPGGTALASFTIPGTHAGEWTYPIANSLFFPSSSWYDCAANVWYRSVIVPAANMTAPRKGTASGSPDTEVLSAIFPCNGNYHWIEESGGAWDDSQTTKWLHATPLFVPTDAAASGGMLVHPGMSGGMRG